MLKSITVQRSGVGNGLLEPVQTSQNSQIAINNSDHLTILEPKLPLLHQAVSSVTINGKTQNYLEATELYDVCTVLHMENLDLLGLQIFSRILIEDGESHFSFTRIAEPSVVGHKWSPIENSTRDCYLGILLNTGEVLVLKRQSVDASEYTVAFRSFTCLLDQMHIPQERLTAEGDIILRNEQYLELKVTSFEFAKFENGDLVISLAHESGKLSIHKLEAGLPLLESFDAGGLVVKQLWNARTSILYYALNDNSVHLCPIDSNGRLRSPHVAIKSPSRFMISQLNILAGNNHLVLVDTTTIYFLDENGTVASHKLPFRSTVSSIPIIETSLKSSVFIAYESGQVCMAHLKGESITIGEAPSAWQTLVNKTLYKYQVLVVKEKQKAPSQVFLNFLSDNVEANFYNYGTKLMTNGTLVTVYNLTPRHTIHYKSKSKMEFSISFLPVKEIEPEFSVEPVPTSNSLSKLNTLFVNDIENIPIVSSAIIERKLGALKDFIESVYSWKVKSYGDVGSVDLEVELKGSLGESLAHNFRDNATISKLQVLYTTNVSVLRTLHALNPPGNTSTELDNLIMALATEQDAISQKLRVHLASIFIHYATEHSSEFEAEFDKFMLLNYHLILSEDKSSQIHEKARVTISTEICTETFELLRDGELANDFLKYLNSTSNHKWPRCDLTFLPILDLTSKSNELELHNFSNYKDLGSKVYDVAFDMLDYCVYSGTRTFNTKVGV